MRQVFIWLLLTAAGFAQGGLYNDMALNSTGRPAAGASIRPCSSTATGTPCSPVQHVYSDAALTIQKDSSSAITADANGNFFFYGTPGPMKLQVTASGSTYTYTVDVPIDATNASITRLNGIRYASLFLGTDIGAKINAACADLPVTGGTVYLPSTTSCELFTTPVVITNSCRLVGLGTGNNTTGIQTSGAAEPSCVQWNAASGDAISVNLSGTVLHGVGFENFTLRGNRNVGGVTSGSGIVFNGGGSATQMTGVEIRNVTVRDFKEYGVRLRDNIYLSNFYDLRTITNVLDGISIDQVTTGVPSQLRFFGGTSLQNDRDGVRINAGATSSIEFHGFTSSNNGANGINAIPVVYIFGGQYESNVVSGIKLSGPGSKVDGASPINNSVGIDVLTSDTTLSGIPAGGNAIADIRISSGNNNLILNPGNTTTILDEFHGATLGNRTSQLQASLGVQFLRNPAGIRFWGDNVIFSQFLRNNVTGDLEFTPEATTKLKVLGPVSATALTSTVGTGTAPLTVSSTTNVPNLNASSLNGATFAAPGAIGGGTPAAGAFTAITAATYNTTTNCSSTGGTCAAAAAGSVTIAAAATTVTVATTAVTANSQIFVQEDSSLGTKLSVTCNTTTGRTYTVTARTASTSFVITASGAPVTNPACLSYKVVN